MADVPLQNRRETDMIAWYLVIALCLVDGLLCHELMKAWDELSKRRKGE